MKMLGLLNVRISEAAQRLGISPRMLRYREDLGLVPALRGRGRSPSGGGATGGVPDSRGMARWGTGAPGRETGAAGGTGWGTREAGRGTGTAGRETGAAGRGTGHRQFTESDLDAIRAGMELERRYDITPAALAFGLRVLTEPAVRAAVADLGRRTGHVPAGPERALDFEKERALRALGAAAGRERPSGPQRVPDADFPKPKRHPPANRPPG